MATRKTPPKKPKRTARTPTLQSLRQQIDRLDHEMVELINQRAQLALQIGRLKDTAGQSIYSPSREEQVLSRAVELSKGPLSDRCVRAVFREVISGARSLERRLRVAFLGPEYTYSHLAVLERFGQCIELAPVSSISAVFEEVNQGQSDYGLVPLENSTDGRIADTLDMFTKLPVRICGEVQLWIHHNLLGKCSRGDVKEVYSKPQALSQCRNWLAKHLMNARAIEVPSTSVAAQLAREKPNTAAIASLQAGVHYGLDVLARNIEDNQANLTRFAVIGHQSAERTGKDKTAILFQIEHRHGTLADAMAIFKRNRVNLTWIESFPTDLPEGGYLFFLEFDGHERDVRVRRALASLGRKTERLEVFGSYAKSIPVR